MSILGAVVGWANTKLSGRDDAETLKRERHKGSNTAGKRVAPETVLTLATAWSCIRLLAETIATLPLSIYERDGDEKKSKRDHSLYALLHDSPNADQSAAEFWEGMITCLCLWGNGYALKDKIGDRLVSLTPLRPDRMTVFRNHLGRRRYRVTDHLGTHEYDEDEIFHLRGFGVGGDVGLSPISYARQTMGTALAADETAAATFANGLQLSGFLEMPAGTKTTSPQRKELMELFAEFAGSSQAGKVMPLPDGSKFVALGMNPEDAQLLQTRSFHVEEICRWYRVPPFMVGHTQNSTSWGTGLEQQMIGFLTFSLRPYLTRIEQAVKKQLIKPSERETIFAEFNLEGLLRADSQGRAALLSALGQNGYLTRNEGRAMDNRAPMPGGDVLTVQSNLVPLDQLGAALGDQQARSAFASWLGIDQLIEERVKNLIGHNGGPALEPGK